MMRHFVSREIRIYLLFSRSHSYSWKSLNAISVGSRVDRRTFLGEIRSTEQIFESCLARARCGESLRALFFLRALRYSLRSKTRLSVKGNFVVQVFKPLTSIRGEWLDSWRDLRISPRRVCECFMTLGVKRHHLLNVRRINNLFVKLVTKSKYILRQVHGKNDFAEGSKILLDHHDNFVGTLEIMSNAAKNFNILATNFSVLHNYFDSLTKLFFLSVFS